MSTGFSDADREELSETRTPGGQNLVTGNERNEWGLVSAEPVNRKKMIEKRHLNSSY